MSETDKKEQAVNAPETASDGTVLKDVNGAGEVAEAGNKPENSAIGDAASETPEDFEESYGAYGETSSASSVSSAAAGEAADSGKSTESGEAGACSVPASGPDGFADTASASDSSSDSSSVPPAVPASEGGHPTADDSLPASFESTLPDAVQKDAENAEDDDEGGEPMSLLDHMRELRKRLVVCLIAALIGFLGCWAFVEPIFNILTEPLLAVLPAGSSAMYTTLPEAFFIRMFIAFISGLFAVSPFIFYQIWAFISPGLYSEERHFIIPVALVSAVFFAGGGLFCYFIVFHYAFQFFVSFATDQIVNMPKISDYLDFVLKLILAFGFVFEMPIFAFFLSRMGAVTAAQMRKFRPYAVLLIFIAAAILTPPDVVSQLLMAVPMLLLYEVSILVAAVCGKKRKAAAAAEETADEADGDLDSLPQAAEKDAGSQDGSPDGQGR